MDDTVREAARLDALHQLNLLDTSPSESFDRITRMASQLFGLPVSAVSLTDRDRQWFKSRVGIDHCSIPRERAPCAQVAETRDVVVLPDLLADACYADSILAASGVRFYAGAPLVTREGYGLGALCVLGTEPRQVTAAETSALRDLADMVMAQIELQHAYGHIDPISGLPNRNQFLDDLEDLGRDAPDQPRLAVLVDLARTDQLASSARVMGASFVDEMVQDAARTIRGAIGHDRLAYHVGVTQFAFLAQSDTELGDYLPQVREFLTKFRQQPNRQFLTTAAVGVAPFVTAVTPPRDVLRMAISAAHDARTSETLLGIYSPTSDRAHHRRFRLLNDFGAALDDPGQLHVVYQPRVALPSGECQGVEALMRWRHPELGDVSPAEFIPIVEQTALARRTTAWILESVLAQLAIWRRSGLHLRVSVNVSAVNLEEQDFADAVQLRLMKHRLPADALELEVTESAVMTNATVALDQLGCLHAGGVQLAIDDFGTGHSSLAYLQRLPAHVVKIDQSFVRDVLLGDRERALVRSMVTLSHDLGYRVVAEGVETREIADAVTALGCDEAQGYYYARPLAAVDLECWLGDRHALPAAQAA